MKLFATKYTEYTREENDKNFKIIHQVRSSDTVLQSLVSPITSFLEQCARDYLRYQILTFNCTLRRSEGFFINRSLLSMKQTITKLIINALQTKFKAINKTQNMAPQIINYLGPVYDGCYNNNFKYNTFDFFNLNEKISPSTLQTYSNQVPTASASDEGEMIFRLIFTDELQGQSIKGFNLDPSNTSLMILTVINITDGSKTVMDSFDKNYYKKQTSNIKAIVNNPPNPPYINTNSLKVAVNLSVYIQRLRYWVQNMLPENKEHIENEIRKIVSIVNKYRKEFYTRMCMYPFYALNTEFMKLLNSNTFLDLDDMSGTRQVIDMIEANNETTLIGTTNFLAFTQVMTPDGIYPICDGINDNMVNHALNPAVLLKQIEDTFMTIQTTTRDTTPDSTASPTDSSTGTTPPRHRLRTRAQSFPLLGRSTSSITT